MNENTVIKSDLTGFGQGIQCDSAIRRTAKRCNRSFFTQFHRDNLASQWCFIRQHNGFNEYKQRYGSSAWEVYVADREELFKKFTRACKFSRNRRDKPRISPA